MQTTTRGGYCIQRQGRYLLDGTDLKEDKKTKPYRLTPIILTANETILSDVDIRALVEMGLSTIRFRMTMISREDKIKLLKCIEHAEAWMCEKYDTSAWPLARCLDLPNATIRTGYIDEHIKGQKVLLKQDSIVTITCDIRYWNKCTESLIYIDDTYTTQRFIPGLELTIFFRIVLHCIEFIDNKNSKFKVSDGGELQSHQFVCLRGIQYRRPPLLKRDVELLKFAEEFRFDVITIYTVRCPNTILMVRKILGDDYKPLILSAICDQQGLSCVEEIINVSDGIILARDFLAHQLIESNRLVTIQMHLSGKCKALGKMFFLSGSVLEHALEEGVLYGSELSDITNGVIQGAGFLLRRYYKAQHVLSSLNTIDKICREVESTVMPQEYLRLMDETKLPVNAAEAAIMGCAFMATQVRAGVIIVSTVTGKTAIELSNIASHIIIIALTRDQFIARKLQLYSGIIAVVYNKPPQYPYSKEMNARVEYAVKFCVKMEMLKYNDVYIVLRKSKSECSFCDHVSSYTVSNAAARDKLSSQ